MVFFKATPKLVDIENHIKSNSWRLAKLLLEDLVEKAPLTFVPDRLLFEMAVQESLETGATLGALRAFGFLDPEINLRWNVLCALQAGRYSAATAFWADLHNELPHVYGLDFEVRDSNIRDSAFGRAIHIFALAIADESREILSKSSRLN